MTSALLPIITSIPSAGSEDGDSKYFGTLACPKKQALDEKYRGQNPLAFQSKYSMALVGTIGHKFYETYFKLQLPQDGEAIVFQLNEGVDEQALHDAERCFRKFRALFPPTVFGKVLHVEEDIEHTFKGPLEPGSPLLQGLIGPLRTTGRLDLATRMTQKVIDNIKSVFNNVGELELDGFLDILKPGDWLFDWKHRSRRDKNLMDRAIDSFQYAGYWRKATTTFPKRKWLGTVQMTIFVQKEPGFRLTVIPPPNATQLMAYEKALRYAKSLPPYLAIPLEGNCFPYGGICPHLHNGCERM